MPIPDRLRPPPISDDDLRSYTELCQAIEDGLEMKDDVSELLTRWNRRAGREYLPSDFNYHGAQDTEVFISKALFGAPPLVADLTYDELRSVLAAVCSADLPEAEDDWFIEWLERNLPGSNISDLIYWPNEWFGDERLLHAELSDDRLLRYAMLKSGRVLPDAPADVELPYPMPGTAS
jgi:hypothetical protein